MAGFRKVDNMFGVPVQNRLVEGAHVPGPQSAAPAVVVLKRSCKFDLFCHHRNLILPALLWVLQADSLAERTQFKSPQIACRRHQRAVEGVSVTVQEIDAGGVTSQALHQLHFCHLAVCRENLFSLLFGKPLLAQRQVLLDYVFHRCFQLPDFRT